MKKKTNPRFPDYERVIMDEVVTFGTTVFIRKDKRALIIVFPCGQELHFKPDYKIEKEKKAKDNFTA